MISLIRRFIKKLIIICVLVTPMFQNSNRIAHSATLKKSAINTLQAGAAKIDITPRFGRWAEFEFPVPYSARALVLTKDETKIVIISAEVVTMKRELSHSIRRQIAERIGIPESHIMICATHTHSIPRQTFDIYRKGNDPESSRASDWDESLVQKYVQVVDEALKKLTPAQVGVGKGYEDTIGLYSRRWMKDGNITWWGPKRDQGPPAGPFDPEVGVILIRDLKGAVISTVWNYTCHPMGIRTSDGKGADYAGWTSQAIEQELGGVALFTLGAAGNCHIDHVQYKTCEEMSKPITYEVLRVARGIKTSDKVTIKAMKKEIILPARDFDSIDPRQIGIIASQAPGGGKANTSLWLKELEDRKKKNERSVTTSVQVIAIGNTLLVGNPGELFVELGMQIKRGSGRDYTFIVNYTNDAIGYIPTRVAYQEGGYQTLQRARVAPGGGEQIVQEALDLIARIQGNESKEK